MFISNIKNNYTIYIILIIFVCFFSCNNSEKDNQIKKKINSGEDQKLINANVHLMHTEEEMIANYIERYKWEMIKTNSGLRYFIYKKGKGKSVAKNSKVKINYKTNLINGKQIYSSDIDGQKQINIGKGEIEKGLEEGILLLKVGDKAKFIIPSHLAFGLLGDGKNIPSKATLIYDVELIEVSN